GDLSEGRAWLKTLLQASLPETDAVGLIRCRANALLGAAALAFDQGDWAEAAVYAEESATLFRMVDDKAGLTLALLRLGFGVGPATEQGKQFQTEALALSEGLADKWVIAMARYVVGQGAYFRADYTTARRYLEDALRLLREVGDVLFLPRVLSMLGGVDLALGEYTQARTRLEEALTLVRTTNDPRALALVAGNLGDVARCQGDYRRAVEVYQESLALHRALGNHSDIPGVVHSLGYVALGQGKLEDALVLERESLLAQRDQGNLPGVAEGLTGLAAVAVAQGRLERAARLFGAAEALREQVRPMVWPAERFEWTRHVATLRDRLDLTTLTSAWADGRAMTIEQTVDYALSVEAAKPPSASAPPPPVARHQYEKAYYGGLTAREREIVALIAQGKTNRAIADDLVIAERTVDRHVANMMAKLDFHSRAQIAAWAVEKGLVTSK
ncbi:MAG: tetratricopeptide repeat protein, partial [Anaerolineae bacterium]|nr:tetratricopeptide repeat protein [Anaerolineae bacterium]